MNSIEQPPFGIMWTANANHHKSSSELNLLKSQPSSTTHLKYLQVISNLIFQIPTEPWQATCANPIPAFFAGKLGLLLGLSPSHSKEHSETDLSDPAESPELWSPSTLSRLLFNFSPLLVIVVIAPVIEGWDTAMIIYVSTTSMTSVILCYCKNPSNSWGGFCRAFPISNVSDAQFGLPRVHRHNLLTFSGPVKWVLPCSGTNIYNIIYIYIYLYLCDFMCFLQPHTDTTTFVKTCQKNKNWSLFEVHWTIISTHWPAKSTLLERCPPKILLSDW